jgi:hypothetical protein
MSTGAIVAIVVGAILLIALLATLVPLTRRRSLGRRRERAGSLRQEAHTHRLNAERTRAAADEQAARASREKAEAEELAARGRVQRASSQERVTEAQREMAVAREHHDRARAIDPDAGDTAQEGSGDG